MAARPAMLTFLPAHLARGRRRDVAAAIVQRAAELPPDDRDVLLAIFGEGRTAQAIARANLCEGETDPTRLVLRAASLRRRVRKLAARLLDPAFELVRTRASAWPPMLARVGRARFVLGLSIRETADELKLSLHTVRSMSQAIRTMAGPPASPSRPAPAPPPREVAA